MNHQSIAAVSRGLAPVIHAEIESVKRYFAATLLEMGERISALEKTVPIRGEKGEPGQKGEPGPPGEAGPRGDPGPQGEKGSDGVNGKDGAPGEVGPAGPPGPRGEDGRDGLAGRDGLPGVQGEKGRDGMDGKDGKDGKDGLGIDDVTEELSEDGRDLIRRYWRDGQVVKEFQHRSAAMLYRGTWRSKPYCKGDVVTHGGSSFVALVDTVAKPEISSDWQLAVKRGHHGKDGKDGRDGDRGPPGRDGKNHWDT